MLIWKEKNWFQWFFYKNFLVIWAILNSVIGHIQDRKRRDGQKKIKGVRGLAQEVQPSDLYPYARKSDTWVQKKIIKKQQKKFVYLKKSISK